MSVLSDHITEVIDALMDGAEDQEEILDIIQNVVDAWRRDLDELFPR